MIIKISLNYCGAYRDFDIKTSLNYCGAYLTI